MPTIQALGEGWDVTVITDASGAFRSRHTRPPSAILQQAAGPAQTSASSLFNQGLTGLSVFLKTHYAGSCRRT